MVARSQKKAGHNEVLVGALDEASIHLSEAAKDRLANRLKRIAWIYWRRAKCICKYFWKKRRMKRKGVISLLFVYVFLRGKVY